MMAAREEAVKWMGVYSLEYLNQDTRSKIFRHEFKHESAGVFYFLSGALHAIDFVAGGLEILKEKDPEISDATETLLQVLSKKIDDPAQIAEAMTLPPRFNPG
jgi:hypothetical protein